MFQISVNGIPLNGNPHAFSKSDCGTMFDEYWRRATPTERFPSDPSCVSSRVVKLWKNRRLEVLVKQRGKWRPAKVIHMVQSNSTPFAPTTNWNCEIEFEKDTLSRTEAKIVRPYKSNVEVEGIAAKFELTRCSISKGGVFSGKYSFRWLDPANPSINVEGIPNCPFCRRGGVIPSDKDKKRQVCGVCMNSRVCKKLGCGHFICSGCWDNWTLSVRKRANLIPPILPSLNRREIVKSRKSLAAEYLKKTKGKSLEDEEEVFLEYFNDIFMPKVISVEECDCCDCLESFRRELLCGPAFFVWMAVNTPPFEYMLEQIDNIKIFEALDECLIERSNVFAKELNEKFGKLREHSMSNTFRELRLCNQHVGEKRLFVNEKAGESCEGKQNYDIAIHYYKRCVKLHDEGYQRDDKSRTISNLGLATKRACKFSDALDLYKEALEIVQSNDTRAKASLSRNVLVCGHEMEKWTGTANEYGDEIKRVSKMVKEYDLKDEYSSDEEILGFWRPPCINFLCTTDSSGEEEEEESEEASRPRKRRKRS
eukprot:g4030.t1